MNIYGSFYDPSVINITPVVQYSAILGRKTIYIGWIVSFIAIEWQ